MDLSIPEKFLILAQHPSKGRLQTQDLYLKYGLAGAFLLEMSNEKMIRIENKRVILKDARQNANPIISEIQEKMKDSDRPRRIQYWLMKIQRKHSIYKWIILNSLAEKRIMRIEQKRFLSLIPYKRTYLLDIKKRYSLISQLTKSVLSRKDIGEDKFAILGLIEACKMHKMLTTDKSELKTLRSELKRIIKESPIASGIDATIKQIQIAIIASIAVAASAAASRR